MGHVKLTEFELTQQDVVVAANNELLWGAATQFTSRSSALFILYVDHQH